MLYTVERIRRNTGRTAEKGEKKSSSEGENG